jgi:hypothetical protein
VVHLFGPWQSDIFVHFKTLGPTVLVHATREPLDLSVAFKFLAQ